MLDETAPPTLGTALQERVHHEVLPDVAIYRSQLINVLPDGWALPVSMYRNSLDAGSQTGELWWHVVFCLSRASAELASYLEPRDHGVPSSTSHLMQAIEHLHASATTLATAFGVDLARAHRARLEALLGASLPTSLIDEADADP